MHPKEVKSPCPYSDMLVSASSETMRGTQDMQKAHLESLKVAHHSLCLSGVCWGLSGSPRETTSVKHYWFRGAARWQRAGLAYSRPCVRSMLSTGVGECLTYLYQFCINIYNHNSRNLRGSFIAELSGLREQRYTVNHCARRCLQLVPDSIAPHILTSFSHNQHELAFF